MQAIYDVSLDNLVHTKILTIRLLNLFHNYRLRSNNDIREPWLWPWHKFKILENQLFLSFRCDHFRIAMLIHFLRQVMRQQRIFQQRRHCQWNKINYVLPWSVHHSYSWLAKELEMALISSDIVGNNSFSKNLSRSTNGVLVTPGQIEINLMPVASKNLSFCKKCSGKMLRQIFTSLRLLLLMIVWTPVLRA